MRLWRVCDTKEHSPPALGGQPRTATRNRGRLHPHDERLAGVGVRQAERPAYNLADHLGTAAAEAERTISAVDGGPTPDVLDEPSVAGLPFRDEERGGGCPCRSSTRSGSPSLRVSSARLRGLRWQIHTGVRLGAEGGSCSHVCRAVTPVFVIG